MKPYQLQDFSVWPSNNSRLIGKAVGPCYDGSPTLLGFVDTKHLHRLKRRAKTDSKLTLYLNAEGHFCRKGLHDIIARADMPTWSIWLLACIETGRAIISRFMRGHTLSLWYREQTNTDPPNTWHKGVPVATVEVFRKGFKDWDKTGPEKPDCDKTKWPTQPSKMKFLKNYSFADLIHCIRTAERQVTKQHDVFNNVCNSCRDRANKELILNKKSIQRVFINLFWTLNHTNVLSIHNKSIELFMKNSHENEEY